MNSETSAPKIPESPGVSGGIAGMMGKQKMYVLGAGVVALLLIGGIIFVLTLPAKGPGEDGLTPVTGVSPTPLLLPSPTLTAELKAAVEEAQQSAQEYGEWQTELWREYRWLRKLPYANEKVYVYYDLDQATFIGEIHYRQGDDIEAIKKQTLAAMKDVRQIPVDQFPIKWEIDQ